MLKELRLNNLAIIKKLDLDFSKGLISLTGETGAGKSIILDGISLLIGERGSLDMIRRGEDALFAEGIFDINSEQKEKIIKLGYDLKDDELIINRSFDKNSKTKITVNGNRVTVSKLKEIMENILDLVGQHDHQYILNKNFHLNLLDKFLDKDGRQLYKEIRENVKDLKKLNKKITELENERKQIIKEKDIYEFKLEEIEKVKLKINDDEELEEEYKTLFNAGKITNKLEEGINLIRNDEFSIIHMLEKVKRNLEQLENISSVYSEYREKIENSIYEIDDVYDGLEEILERVESDEDRLNKVVEKMNAINKLKLKYGSTVEEILKYRDDIKSKLAKIDFEDDELLKLKKEKKKKTDEYLKKCQILRESRNKIAKYLESEIDNQLKDLNMSSAKFKVNFIEKKVIGSNGMDDVEFLMKTNAGEDFKSLVKIASGGEISRIMLALKVIFSRVDNISTLIFDEIDTGISGETVKKVAEKLKELSNTAQVICVTHSPQIAGKSSQQFLIKKEVEDGLTETKVKELDMEERVKEVARIISGDNITEASLNHAREIIGIE